MTRRLSESLLSSSTLVYLWKAIDDLGVDPEEVRFLEGYAVVSDEAEYEPPALYPHAFAQPGSGMNFCGVPGCGRTIAQHEGWVDE